MKRPIRDFAQDDLGDWYADLTCGHRQHTRHNPPLSSREWVLTESGRASRIGTELDCVRCDRSEMPEGFEPYKKTPEFDETTVPKGLRANHSTKVGVWGLIHVESGKLEYTSEGESPPGASGDGAVQMLSPETRGIVVPEVKHRVEPIGSVRFYVEFWRRPKTASTH